MRKRGAFRLGNDERGAAMVEFALALPLLAGLTFGVVTDYGAPCYLGRNRLGTTDPDAAKGEVNAKMLETCANVKARGIEIYTIIVEVPDATANDTFRACATREDMYYDADSNAEMKGAFREIAGRIGELRLVG